MLKRIQGWGGVYRWGKYNRWSNGNWDKNALHSAQWTQSWHGLSLADGAAFVDILGANLGPYAGVEGTSTPWKLILRDPAGIIASGFIGELDDIQALGGQLVTNPAFATDIANWNNSALNLYDTFEWSSGKLHAVSDGTGVSALGTDDNVAFTVGKLYKIGFTVAVASGVGPRVLLQGTLAGGEIRILFHVSALVDNHPSGSYAYYYTATATENAVLAFWHNSEVGDYTLDNILVREVTHMAATGVHIVSAKGGSTRNWASIGAGFDYNAASYRAEIWRA